MDALYAFARIADDSSDGEEVARNQESARWNIAEWRRWVDSLTNDESITPIKQLDPSARR